MSPSARAGNPGQQARGPHPAVRDWVWQQARPFPLDTPDVLPSLPATITGVLHAPEITPTTPL